MELQVVSALGDLCWLLPLIAAPDSGPSIFHNSYHSYSIAVASNIITKFIPVLKAIKSDLKRSYDKHNLTHVETKLSDGSISFI